MVLHLLVLTLTVCPSYDALLARYEELTAVSHTLVCNAHASLTFSSYRKMQSTNATSHAQPSALTLCRTRWSEWHSRCAVQLPICVLLTDDASSLLLDAMQLVLPSQPTLLRNFPSSPPVGRRPVHGEQPEEDGQFPPVPPPNQNGGGSNGWNEANVSALVLLLVM